MLKVVLDDESSGGEMMESIGFREGKRLSDVTSQPLAERIVPPFDVRCLPALLAHRLVLSCFPHLLIRLPEVAETATPPIRFGQLQEELSTRLHASISDDKSHDLPGPPTQGQPKPPLVRFLLDKTPHLIQLQHVSFLSFVNRFFERRKRHSPLFIQLESV